MQTQNSKKKRSKIASYKLRFVRYKVVIVRYKFVQFCVMSCSCNSRNCLIYLSIDLSIYLSIDRLLCLESQINDQLAVCRFKKNVGQTITYIFYHLLILNKNAYGRSYIYIYILYIRFNVVHLNFLFIKIEQFILPFLFI